MGITIMVSLSWPLSSLLLSSSGLSSKCGEQVQRGPVQEVSGHPRDPSEKGVSECPQVSADNQRPISLVLTNQKQLFTPCLQGPSATLFPARPVAPSRLSIVTMFHQRSAFTLSARIMMEMFRFVLMSLSSSAPPPPGLSPPRYRSPSPS